MAGAGAGAGSSAAVVVGLCLFLFICVFPRLVLLSNRLALCPQAKFTSVSLFYPAICFNCTVVHDRANGRQVPVIKQSGEFKHIRSFPEHSVSPDNR